ncbi:MAG: hypothetical protein HAW61_00275, partial [Candidatus Portiera sp.]|nr:hypothetical protein [Portiera sp.]
MNKFLIASVKFTFYASLAIFVASCAAGGGSSSSNNRGTGLYDQIEGEGTQDDPYVIKNIYQLQAISGFDHEGTPLNKSQHTSNSWLYGDNATDQLTKHYVLGNDIDASATRGWRSELKDESYVRGWRPLGDCSAFAAECPQPLDNLGGDIGGFSGDLDGAGYTISSLYMHVNQTDGIGLFSALDGGSVANFKLDGVIVANITTN